MNIDAHFHRILRVPILPGETADAPLFRETLIENGAERRIQTAAGSFSCS